MGKLRRVVTIASITVLTAFGIAACGGSNKGSGTASEGGDVNVSMTSFPDYIDPQLSYTLEGWEVLWNVYTPLLTYKHQAGDSGTQMVPGLAKGMPDISADGKTYKLTLRPNMKSSDGTPIKASDFTYAIKRLFKADTISGIATDDNTGDITIQLEKPNGTFNNVLALMFAAPLSPTTPLDKDTTNNLRPSSGPFVITKVNAPNT